MSEMIERVAREAFEANMTICQASLGFRHDEHWDTTPEPNRELWRAVARAAVEAMREPTEGMEEAADQPFHDEWKRQKAYSLKHYNKEAYASVGFSLPMWRAMIDEALK